MRTSASSDRLRFLAVLWVAAARLCVWCLPLRWTMRLVSLACVARPPRSGRPTSAAVGEAVRSASRAVPRASCLVQALAAGILLRRAGRPAVLHLGTRGREGDRFVAHAWVESGGLIVVGGDVSSQVELARYDLADGASWSAAGGTES